MVMAMWHKLKQRKPSPLPSDDADDSHDAAEHDLFDRDLLKRIDRVKTELILMEQLIRARESSKR